MEAKQARSFVRKVDSLLRAEFGEPELRPPEDPLDTLIRTILSQNTSDINSDRAFASLQARFGNWRAAAAADESAIEESIRSGGISVVKAHRIKQVLEQVRETMGDWTLAPLRGRSAPAVMKYLTALPGVGVKTAAVVALFSLGIPLFPVDTHVFRISVRLGLVPPGTRLQDAFLLLDALVPNGLKARLHLNLLQHGRRICVARRPRCPICPLNPICPKIGVFP